MKLSCLSFTVSSKQWTKTKTSNPKLRKALYTNPKTCERRFAYPKSCESAVCVKKRWKSNTYGSMIYAGFIEKRVSLRIFGSSLAVAFDESSSFSTPSLYCNKWVCVFVDLFLNFHVLSHFKNLNTSATRGSVTDGWVGVRTASPGMPYVQIGPPLSLS